MFAFSPQAFSIQAFSPAAFAIETAVPPAPTSGGFSILLPKYKPPRKPGRPIEEDEALLLAVLH